MNGRRWPVVPRPKAIINLGWAAWKNKDLEAAYKHGARLLQLDENNPMYAFRGEYRSSRGAVGCLEIGPAALDLLGKDKDASLIRQLYLTCAATRGVAVLTVLLRDFPDNQQIIFLADFSTVWTVKPRRWCSLIG